MLIGGLLKFSLIDYPGKVAAVVFTQGCDFRCPYCHNPDLVLPERYRPALPESEVHDFLLKRRGQLQGVVVTGGEPTRQEDLSGFLGDIKAMGYFVKLDTNGSRPAVLDDLLGRRLLDYVAMDIKSGPAGYARASGVSADIAAVLRSVRTIRESGVEHEFRTTALKLLFGQEDARAVAELVGSSRYVLRRGNLKAGVLAPQVFMDRGDYTDAEWDELRQIAGGKAVS